MGRGFAIVAWLGGFAFGVGFAGLTLEPETIVEVHEVVPAAVWDAEGECLRVPPGHGVTLTVTYDHGQEVGE